MMLTVVGWACDFGQWMHSPVQSGFGPKAGKPTDRTNGAKLRLTLLRAIKGRRPMVPIATLAASGRGSSPRRHVPAGRFRSLRCALFLVLLNQADAAEKDRWAARTTARPA